LLTVIVSTRKKICVLGTLLASYSKWEVGVKIKSKKKLTPRHHSFIDTIFMPFGMSETKISIIANYCIGNPMSNE